MSAEIKIDPAEALRRIITNLATTYRRTSASRKRRGITEGPFWAMISKFFGYGRVNSAHLATSHGFNADTGEAL
jgi:hypothetical protein